MNLGSDSDLEAFLARFRPVEPPRLSLPAAVAPGGPGRRFGLAAAAAAVVAVVLVRTFDRAPAPRPEPATLALVDPRPAPEEPIRPSYARLRAAAAGGPEALDRCLERVSHRRFPVLDPISLAQ